MRLPEFDEQYLKEKGYEWELLPDGGSGALVIKNYSVASEKYDHGATDLLVLIPAQYNNAGLDMFYVDPPLHLKNGNYPQAAETFEDHAGRHWQRFSRHLGRPWNPGVDGLPGFLALISKELQVN